MQKTVSNETVSMIKRYLPEIGIQLPLRDEEDIEKISDFFEEMEISLSNALGCGERIDRQLLNSAACAFDDLAIIEDDDFHDVDDLNKRLLG
jgi:hypothetical protein